MILDVQVTENKTLGMAEDREIRPRSVAGVREGSLSPVHQSSERVASPSKELENKPGV